VKHHDSASRARNDKPVLFSTRSGDFTPSG
jgi:hypothetical protein